MGNILYPLWNLCPHLGAWHVVELKEIFSNNQIIREGVEIFFSLELQTKNKLAKTFNWKLFLQVGKYLKNSSFWIYHSVNSLHEEFFSVQHGLVWATVLRKNIHFRVWNVVYYLATMQPTIYIHECYLLWLSLFKHKYRSMNKKISFEHNV